MFITSSPTPVKAALNMIGVEVGGGLFGASFRVHGTLGPRILTGTLLGLAWGVVGCGIGGGVSALRRNRAAPTTAEA